MELKTVPNNIHKFEGFFRSFINENSERKYLDKINDMIQSNTNSIVILIEDLYKYDQKLTKCLIEEPEDTIDDAIQALVNITKSNSNRETLPYSEYFIRITTNNNVCNIKTSIRDLNIHKLSKLIICEGIVVKTTDPKIRLKIASFECNFCGAKFNVIQLKPKIKYPRFCVNIRCIAKNFEDFYLDTKLSEFIDYQTITIQEILVAKIKGSKARKILAVLSNDLVDSVEKGDSVELTGIYRTDYYYIEKQRRINNFNGVIDVNYIKSR